MVNGLQDNLHGSRTPDHHCEVYPDILCVTPRPSVCYCLLESGDVCEDQGMGGESVSILFRASILCYIQYAK